MLRAMPPAPPTILLTTHDHAQPTTTPTAAATGRRQAARATRAAPKMVLEASPLTEVAAPFQQASSVVLADYFSTVDEIARGIGDRPWLQYFIPTAVGMSISLAIVFSLYIAAQPYEPPSK